MDHIVEVRTATGPAVVPLPAGLNFALSPPPYTQNEISKTPLFSPPRAPTSRCLTQPKHPIEFTLFRWDCRVRPGLLQTLPVACFVAEMFVAVALHLTMLFLG